MCWIEAMNVGTKTFLFSFAVNHFVMHVIHDDTVVIDLLNHRDIKKEKKKKPISSFKSNILR